MARISKLIIAGWLGLATLSGAGAGKYLERCEYRRQRTNEIRQVYGIEKIYGRTIIPADVLSGFREAERSKKIEEWEQKYKKWQILKDIQYIGIGGLVGLIVGYAGFSIVQAGKKIQWKDLLDRKEELYDVTVEIYRYSGGDSKLREIAKEHGLIPHGSYSDKYFFIGDRKNARQFSKEARRQRFVKSARYNYRSPPVDQDWSYP